MVIRLDNELVANQRDCYYELLRHRLKSSQEEVCQARHKQPRMYTYVLCSSFTQNSQPHQQPHIYATPNIPLISSKMDFRDLPIPSPPSSLLTFTTAQMHEYYPHLP